MTYADEQSDAQQQLQAKLQEILKPEVFSKLHPDEQAQITKFAQAAGVVSPPAAPRTTAQKIYEGIADFLNPTSVGSMVGAGLGASTGIPGLGVVGGAAGAGVGSLAESGIKSLVGQASAPNISQALMSGAIQGAMQGVTGLGIGLAKKIFYPSAGRFSPSAQLAKDQIEAIGAQPMPSEITGSPIQIGMERRAARSIFGEKRVEEALRARGSLIDKTADDILAKASTDPVTQGLVREAIMGPKPGGIGSPGSTQLFHSEAVPAAYATVDNALSSQVEYQNIIHPRLPQIGEMPQAAPRFGETPTQTRKLLFQGDPNAQLRTSPVDTTPIPINPMLVGPGVIDTAPIKESLSVLAKDRAIVDAASKTLAAGTGGNILTELIDGLPPKISFQDAATLRGRALTKSRDIMTVFGSEGQRVVASVSGILDSAMSKTAKEAGPKVYDAWRAANDFYRKGAEVFGSNLVKRAVDEAPELLTASINPRTPVGEIIALKNAITGKIEEANLALALPQDAAQRAEIAYRGLARGVLEKLLDDSRVGAGRIDANRLLGYRFNDTLNQYSPEVLREIFDPKIFGADYVPKLLEFGETVARMENAQKLLGQTGAGWFGHTIHVLPSGMLAVYGAFDVMGGRPEEAAKKAAAAGVLLLPSYAMARAMTSPGGLNWIIRGINTPVSAGARAAAIAARVAAAAGASKMTAMATAQ